MDSLEIARESVRTLWRHKSLWVLGFFVAPGSGGGGGGGGGGGSGSAGPGGASVPDAALPWLVLAGVAALGIAVAFFVVHLVCEGALIEAVRRGRGGERLGLRRGLREGRRHAMTLAAIKLLAFGLGLLGMVPLATVALMMATEVLSLAAGLTLAVPLGLVTLPVLLTIYFVYQYAMRFAVLEDRTAMDAVRDARRFLHGRLAPSLKLTVVSYLGQIGGSLIAVLLLLPAAALGLAAYFSAGLAVAIGVALLVGLPLLLPAIGAMGTYRSSVWTLGFLEQRS